MDESDEDIDPLMGPVADLMAEHNLSSSTIITDIKTPIETIMIIPEQKIKFRNYLSYLNLRQYFKDIFQYILDIQWYSSLHKISPKIEQEIPFNQKPLTKLSLIFLIYAILTSSFPLIFHILLFFYIFFLFLLDFLFPLYIYYNWFQCLNFLRKFISTIQIHQQWLINIHGFQLIRPTSSLFENHLYKLRRKIFEELQKHFLFSRQISRQYSIENDQLICYIDLNEFGPLIQINNSQLEEITNKFDQISINSLLKLCHLQINECIQLINLNRPKSYWIFNEYKNFLINSIENLNKQKQNCSIMIDYVDLEKKSLSNKFLSSYFLLRSNCEQLFEINEIDSYNNIEQLKRIIQDLKTVIYSLEAIQIKPIKEIYNQINNTEEILGNDNQSINISSYHRYDDKINESIDEILICDTGKLDNENENKNFEFENYNQILLREQTNCLMKELQTAIQGKKQEWNEREQRLLGNIENQENILEEKKLIINEQQFEKVLPTKHTISMLDELKHTFVLNRKKLNINEDIFGEDEIENFDDE